MTIDWWTLALQAVNFLVLVWLLWRFLYRPVRGVIEKRRKLAEEAFAEAEKREADADAARRRLEAERADLVREREDLLARLHEEMEAERTRTVEEARAEAAKMLDQARAAVAEEREIAFREARAHVAALAGDLAATLLGKVGESASNGPFLEKLVEQFAALPAEERDRLREDLGAPGAALPADEQARWRERLSAGLGVSDGIAFASDPEILGGAELRFPHAALRFSWAEQLRRARGLLQGDDAAS